MQIKCITINTNSLLETKQFYVEVLGFYLISEDEQSFILQVGKSTLKFVEQVEQTKPFYHFAFTICANQFLPAKKWLQDKVTLNTEDGKDEVQFSRGRSLYFEDPSGNIVEFYGRNYFVNNKSFFSIKDIIEISEMSLTTKNVMETGKKLLEHGLLHLDDEDLTEHALNFIGSDNVYFLVGPVGRVWFFSSKNAEIHPVTVELNGGMIVSVNKKGALTIY